METRRKEGENGDEHLCDTSQESVPFTIPYHLPDDLITEILLRLPVKSLLKFRCVSKSWLSTISSSQFVRAHVKISSQNKSSSHHWMLAGDMHCSLQSLLNESIMDTAASLYNHPRKASCDGLILADMGKYLVLSNPYIRKSKTLPGLIFLSNTSPVNYGISYDDSSDDYRVVATLVKYDTEKVYSGYEVKVCSVKTESWRTIGDFHGVMPLANQVNLNGKLHWLERLDDGASQRLNIVSLDLAAEKFGVLEAPRYEVAESGLLDGDILKLLLLSGQFLCVYYTFADHGDVWVMKEYGEKKSWNKLLTIPFDTIDGLLFGFTPIHISGNYEIILYGDRDIAVYNPKNEKVKFPKMEFVKLPRNCFIIAYSSYNPCIYVASLVSPI